MRDVAHSICRDATASGVLFSRIFDEHLFDVDEGRHKASVGLEHLFRSSLKDIPKERGIIVSELISEIYANPGQSDLSSAVRVFVLDYFKARAAGPASPGRE